MIWGDSTFPDHVINTSDHFPDWLYFRNKSQQDLIICGTFTVNQFIYLVTSLSQDHFLAVLLKIEASRTEHILVSNVLVFVQLMQTKSGPRKIQSFINELVCHTPAAANGVSTTLFLISLVAPLQLFMEDVAPNQRVIHNELFHQERRRLFFISRSRRSLTNKPQHDSCNFFPTGYKSYHRNHKHPNKAQTATFHQRLFCFCVKILSWPHGKKKFTKL